MTREEQIKEAQVSEITKILDSNCEDIPDTVCQQYRCGECKARQIYDTGYRKQSHGHWEIVEGSNGKEKMVCTNCQHQQDLASTFTYCPNCGAKMDGTRQ